MFMKTIEGKYAAAKVFTENIENAATEQILTLCNQSFVENCKIRIMPDVHAGTGCVIGFTANLGNKVIPSLVGVDIGCGMFVVELGKVDINLKEFDKVIHENVPAGTEVHGDCCEVLHNPTVKLAKELHCSSALCNKDRLILSMGTLGGGNHFIELDVDEEENKYLVIHTGSRNLGKQVAEYYQNIAISNLIGNNKRKEKIAEIVSKLKSEGKQQEIENTIKSFKMNMPNIPKDLCYLVGDDREKYLHDMKLCQSWAMENRITIARTILGGLGLNTHHFNSWSTVHNYIDFSDNIIRKGSVSAKKGEKLIIPLNMRDGSLICVGKGNEDWNCSAPHGAGRLYSRTAAMEKFSVEEYQKQMNGIYTTSVNTETLDECPMAYKPAQEIIDAISPTVEIINHIRPIYNFKAGN